LGAIVVIAAKGDKLAEKPAGSIARTDEGLFPGPLACVNVCGRSVLERMIDRYLQARVEVVSVLVEVGLSASLLRTTREYVDVQVVEDLNSAVARTLLEFSSDGIEHAFLNSVDTYTETDLFDLFCFHRGSRVASTRAFDGRGPLDLWVADCAKAQAAGIGEWSKQSEPSASYLVRGYVSRLSQSIDLRHFATDLLSGRCESVPSGTEIRPRVWIGEGADLHRRARIVAPAYIGHGSKVREDVVITRCSNIERDCFIDSGTVIDNSTVLPRTHIGIWLDVCNAVVSENRFLSLNRGVTIAISDSGVMRSTFTERRDDSGACLPNVCQKKAIELQMGPPLRGSWQFGANLFQE
jgi:NDP-sugar pyrophosphorylase family protein